MKENKSIKNERLAKLRENKGLTQQQLGKAVGLSQSMIAYIEAGRKDPGKIYKIRLAKFFGVSVDWLFYELYDDLKLLEQASTNDKVLYKQ